MAHFYRCQGNYVVMSYVRVSSPTTSVLLRVLESRAEKGSMTYTFYAYSQTYSRAQLLVLNVYGIMQNANTDLVIVVVVAQGIEQVAHQASVFQVPGTRTVSYSLDACITRLLEYQNLSTVVLVTRNLQRFVYDIRPSHKRGA